MIGSNKVQKTVKTKFRKNDDLDSYGNSRKSKHHDKSYYRLMKEEKKEYELSTNITETD